MSTREEDLREKTGRIMQIAEVHEHEPGEERRSLGEALPMEIGRVMGVIEIYATIPTGKFAIEMMKADINKATVAMAEGDVVAMIRAYQSLKTWKL